MTHNPADWDDSIIMNSFDSGILQFRSKVRCSLISKLLLC